MARHDKIPVYILDLPEYQADSEPDSEAIGKILDDEFKKRFMGEDIVFRGVGSSEHPDKSQDELVEIIRTSGTDRYDPERKGDRYENVEGKHIDFFGFPCQITPDLSIGYMLIWGFYHSAIAIHGYPMRIDIVSVYDPKKLEQIKFTYEGREHEGQRDDGFAFKDSNNKSEALKAIIKITE